MKSSKLFTLFATLVVLSTLMVAEPPNKESGKQSLTGVVSDSMCGAKHMMAGNEASCTHECVKNGSKYALVVGDKVYTLETTDKSALDKLSDLAGKSAKVTGEVKNETVAVKSVAAGS